MTDDMLISSSINEPDTLEPEYDATKSYAEFDQVSVITDDSHLVYESLVAANAGNPVTNTAKWIQKTNTNRWRMFDFNQGNPSVGNSPLTVVIRPGQRVDSIAIEMQATLLDITVRQGLNGPIAYTLDGYLVERSVTTFYEYFFAPSVYTKMVASFQLPPIADPVITVTLSDPSGTVEVSRLGVGRATHLGTIQWNPIVDSDNYSTIEWDDFGRSTLKPVPSIPVHELKVTTDSNKLNAVRQFRNAANAKACVWSGLDDIEHDYQESLILWGVYTNFQIDITNPAYAELNLSLKGI